MDIYQIIITHNRSWTIREIIAFAVVFLMAVFLAAVLLRLHKIVIIHSGSLWTVASDVSFNCIWFYCFYEDSGDQAVSAGGILVMEGNPGDWYMWQTGKYYGRWFTAGESVEYSATFSGRDFIAGGDRQKTEMVDGIACGNCSIICYRD